MGRRKIALRLAPAIAALLLLAAGCGDDDPSVSISRPEEGSTVDGPDVEVCTDVKNFDVVDRLDEEPQAGEGHIHFYLDQLAIPIDDDDPAVTEDGTYHATAQTCHTWEDLDEGEHAFAVQLVDNDHSALSRPVLDEVEVTVELEASPSPARTPTATPEEEEEEATPTATEEPETPTESPTATPETSPTTTP
jgi:Domain of unknown function (DUF4399)